MFEMNPTDHKSITACHFSRDNTRIEADFSIWKDYGLNKRHYRVHYVWCLNLENTNDFFGTIRKKNTTLRFFLLDRKEILQENDVPLLHRAVCKEFVSFVQKAFRNSCNCLLVLS